jgi:phospholipase/carboxylesterase
LFAAIDGPRIPPAKGGKPDSLVVLLHGYGSNGEDLIGLAPYWRRLLPGTMFIAPDAPEPVAGVPNGRQWFDLGAMTPNLLASGVRNAARSVDAFLNREIERHGFGMERIALVGFSQGTMMALHVGFRSSVAPAALVGFSGALTAPETLKAELKAKPPVLLIHGDSDDRIPASAMFAAGQTIAAAGHGAQWHVSAATPHAISEDGLMLAGAFLADAMAGRLAGPALAL